ncbi:hypothetical protein KI387_027599 [Taxus chinensis]|uniref:Uncharacterized protein n=1 Tax=Taxus chinensis TaxID=29808 RepID=A0AA38FXX5_TAXCH|nr:hypothetical protein KI387_027599 [Taxus chinensis]
MDMDVDGGIDEVTDVEKDGVDIVVFDANNGIGGDVVVRIGVEMGIEVGVDELMDEVMGVGKIDVSGMGIGEVDIINEDKEIDSCTDVDRLDGGEE